MIVLEPLYAIPYSDLFYIKSLNDEGLLNNTNPKSNRKLRAVLAFYTCCNSLRFDVADSHSGPGIA